MSENIQAGSRICIEFGDEDEPPIVHINGDRIRWLTEIKLNWVTASEVPGKTEFSLEYFPDDQIHENPKNLIPRKIKISR
ncbi:hypothetical protein ACMG4J_22550 [Rossellomorea marisflavi]|uniref:hypothetical protein n=1 Tax=Rossellomorea marisflavi TaxID=189381 RepID=UPI0039BF2791